MDRVSAPHRLETTNFDAFWSEVFRRVLISDAYHDHTDARMYTRARVMDLSMAHVVICIRLYPGKSIEHSHVDCPMTSLGTDRNTRAYQSSFSHQLGVGRRRVCLSLLCVSHACARRQRGACVRRAYRREGVVHRTVRACVVCFATRAGAVGATLALPLLAPGDFVYSRGACDVHTYGARV